MAVVPISYPAPHSKPAAKLRMEPKDPGANHQIALLALGWELGLDILSPFCPKPLSLASSPPPRPRNTSQEPRLSVSVPSPQSYATPILPLPPHNPSPM